MCPDTDFQEKMDILDLIINILKEHEGNLQRLANKFESVLNNLYSVETRITGLNESFSQFLFSKEANPKELKPAALVECKEWKEFKEKSTGAHMIAFEVDIKIFTVNSLSGNIVYRYSESLPELKLQVEEGEKRYIVKKMAFDSCGDLYPVFERRLKCGLEVFVKGSKFDLSDNECLALEA